MKKTKVNANEAQNNKEEKKEKKELNGTQEKVIEEEESIIKITCLLIKTIDKKINYKLLFFLILAITIGIYLNQSEAKKYLNNNSNGNDLNLNEANNGGGQTVQTIHENLGENEERNLNKDESGDSKIKDAETSSQSTLSDESPSKSTTTESSIKNSKESDLKSSTTTKTMVSSAETLKSKNDLEETKNDSSENNKKNSKEKKTDDKSNDKNTTPLDENNLKKRSKSIDKESSNDSAKGFESKDSKNDDIEKKNNAKQNKKEKKVEDSLINEKLQRSEDSVINGKSDEPIILSGQKTIQPVSIEIDGDNTVKVKTVNNDEKKMKKRPRTENVKVAEPIIPPEEKEEPQSSYSKQKPVSPDKDIANFRSIKISELKPKKMWIPIPGSKGGHRRVPAVAITAGKEHKSSVKMWLYEEFFTKEECENLIKVHDDHVRVLSSRKPIICFDSIKTLRKILNELDKSEIAQSVTPNDFIEGTRCINQSLSENLGKWGLKWSFTTAFYLGESKFSKVFSRRIEEATQLNETHGGKFQITSYPYQVGYKSHTDCSVDTTDERDRYATFLMYLNDFIGEEGAETNFTQLGVDVKSKTGRALTWNNMNYANGKCEAASVYEINKVNTEAKKNYIIQRWYYYKNFYSLGKRITEPEVPKREEGTPLVSCDSNDNGNCRLYDEWNYEHLLDYENRKQNLKF